MKCSPDTKSSKKIIEIDKIICVDIGVHLFYMCLNVYIYIYIYMLAHT